jgi:hypothetical protein
MRSIIKDSENVEQTLVYQANCGRSDFTKEEYNMIIQSRVNYIKSKESVNDFAKQMCFLLKELNIDK